MLNIFEVGKYTTALKNFYTVTNVFGTEIQVLSPY